MTRLAEQGQVRASIKQYVLVYSATVKVPFIYDIHTEWVRLRWTHADGGREAASCGHPHRKLEPTDVVVLSSSHAKKLVFFVP